MSTSPREHSLFAPACRFYGTGPPSPVHFSPVCPSCSDTWESPEYLGMSVRGTLALCLRHPEAKRGCRLTAGPTSLPHMHQIDRFQLNKSIKTHNVHKSTWGEMHYGAVITVLTPRAPGARGAPWQQIPLPRPAPDPAMTLPW